MSARHAALAAALVMAVGAPASAARRVPAEFASLQSAIDASATGDTVLVAAGTYNERVMLGLGVTLRAEGAPGSVVLDAGHGGPAVLSVGHIVPPRLEGFRLVNGSGHDVGGAALGGVLAVVGGKLDVIDCTFEGGQATYGGLTGATNATVSFLRCSWSGGVASFGGAHFQSGGGLTLADGVITGTSAGAGGGMYVTGGAHGSVLRVSLTGTAASGDGGGLRLDDCVLTLSNVRVDGALAGGRGGGLAIAAGGQVIASATVLVDCSSALGGGLFHLSCAPTLLGPARTLQGAECALLSMTHCDLLLGKGALPAAGAVTDAASFQLESSLVAGNASGLACLDPRATLAVTCSDLYQNGGADLSGSCVANSSGNIAADPHLCDLAGRDFGLCANSPLLSPGCGSAPWGAGVLACSDCGPTPAQRTSWGGLKALYRD